MNISNNSLAVLTFVLSIFSTDASAVTFSSLLNDGSMIVRQGEAVLSNFRATATSSNGSISYLDYEVTQSRAYGDLSSRAFGILFRVLPSQSLSLESRQSFELSFGFTITTPDVNSHPLSIPSKVTGAGLFIQSAGLRGDTVFEVGSSSPDLFTSFSAVSSGNLRDFSEVVPMQTFDFDFFARGRKILPTSGGSLNGFQAFFDLSSPVVVSIPASATFLPLGVVAMFLARCRSRSGHSKCVRRRSSQWRLRNLGL